VKHALTRAEILANWQARQRLVSINDAAIYCGVNPRTIRRRIADGTIHGVTVGKKLVRVDLNEIDERLLRTIPTAG
jgi:excisionase family DNA binding protein